MTQADRVHSTPPPNATIKEDQNHRLATAYRRMEDDVHNLESMGTIASRLVGEWMERITDERAAELANFAVQHLAGMLTQFKNDYDTDYTNSWSAE